MSTPTPLPAQPSSADEARRLLVIDAVGAEPQLPIAAIEGRGYSVTRVAIKGALAVTIGTLDPHLVMIASSDGEEHLRDTLARVRAKLSADRFVPVLVLYPEHRTAEICVGLDGADDFLAAPFQPYELILRLDVLWRTKSLRDELLKINERLKAQSITDDLTGLLKQKELRRRLALEVRRIGRFSIPVACLFFDCDRFKDVNDVYGHEAGSYVLSEIAKRVTDSVRDTDIVARYGGDEFVVGMPGCGVVAAAIVAARIAASVRDTPFIYNGESINCTLSMGVAAASPANPLTVEALLEQADQALFNAKRTGRNRVVVFSEPTG